MQKPLATRTTTAVGGLLVNLDRNNTQTVAAFDTDMDECISVRCFESKVSAGNLAAVSVPSEIEMKKKKKNLTRCSSFVVPYDSVRLPCFHLTLS